MMRNTGRINNVKRQRKIHSNKGITTILAFFFYHIGTEREWGRNCGKKYFNSQKTGKAVEERGKFNKGFHKMQKNLK